MKYKKPIILTEEYSRIGKINSFADAYKFLRGNIVELVFVRRIIPANRTVGHKFIMRRMLCTANYGVIAQAKSIFKWEKPSGNGIVKDFKWLRERNLLLVWDIMMNNWRHINLDEWVICGVFPCYKFSERNEFIKFWKQYYIKYKEIHRLEFSDKVTPVFNN